MRYGAEKVRLEAELAESAELLKKRIMEIAGADEPLVFLADSEDAWGKGDTEEAAVAEMRTQGDIKGQVAYKVYRVHPETEVVGDGQFRHSKFVPAPVLVREVERPAERSLV